MQQGNYTNITWNGTNNFAGYVFEDNIYTITGEQIGVNLAKYQEVEQALLKCKNRLIELGEIKVPKTPEQIIQEQSEMLEKQSQAITQLLEKVNGLEQDYQHATTEHQSECSISATEGTEHSGPDNNTNKRRRSKSSSKLTEQRIESECSEQA